MFSREYNTGNQEDPMRKQIWKTTIAMTAVVLLIAGCGKEKKVQESPEILPFCCPILGVILGNHLDEFVSGVDHLPLKTFIGCPRKIKAESVRAGASWT